MKANTNRGMLIGLVAAGSLAAFGACRREPTQDIETRVGQPATAPTSAEGTQGAQGTSPSATAPNPGTTEGNGTAAHGNGTGAHGNGTGAMGNGNGTPTATGTGSPGAMANGTPGSTAPTAGAMDPQMLVQHLHMDNMMEVQAGKMAQQRGQSKAVKQFGASLAKEHAAFDKKLTAYAQKKGITLTSTADQAATGTTPGAAERAPTGESGQAMPMPHMQEHKAEMERLKTMKGAEFDKAFGAAMAKGHQQTLDMVRASMTNVQDEELKSLLTEVQPTLEKHLQMAQTISGGSAGAGMESESAPAQGRRPSSR